MITKTFLRGPKLYSIKNQVGNFESDGNSDLHCMCAVSLPIQLALNIYKALLLATISLYENK